ncbi:translation initiation factor IF-2 [Sorangium sp. So ce1024]|uniref:translation initiation factor IF-2 n=1 Tax=unclassified Sorangium TaxID=2621164 RepID=UPI003F0C8E7E
MRETLMSRFHEEDGRGAGRLYVDPRLPEGAHLPVLQYLDQAEREVFAQLNLQAQRPDVFVYFDAELLVAAACTNRDVVAYYDGAMHVVATHADVQTSVLHEMTHHVLMSHGMLGPTWVQEGIAMHVAREAWWLDPSWIGRIREAPMALEVMEQAVPYTLGSDEAVLFYVQAASMTYCLARGDRARLRGLLALMGAAGHAAQAELPDDPSQLLEPDAWHACTDGLMRQAGPRG